ncbi:MAG: hypothetical protein AAGA96_14960 [Verrucomicrobiota bacterium]
MTDSSSFEEEVSNFSRSPVPSEWKEKILDAAMEAHRVEPLFGVFARSVTAVIAACWMAIAAFYWITPAEDRSEPVTDLKELNQRELLLVADRVSGRAVERASTEIFERQLGDES